jgi:hypothetical protein
LASNLVHYIRVGSGPICCARMDIRHAGTGCEFGSAEAANAEVERLRALFPDQLIEARPEPCPAQEGEPVTEVDQPAFGDTFIDDQVKRYLVAGDAIETRAEYRITSTLDQTFAHVGISNNDSDPYQFWFEPTQSWLPVQYDDEPVKDRLYVWVPAWTRFAVAYEAVGMAWDFPGFWCKKIDDEREAVIYYQDHQDWYAHSLHEACYVCLRWLSDDNHAWSTTHDFDTVAQALDFIGRLSPLHGRIDALHKDEWASVDGKTYYVCASCEKWAHEDDIKAETGACRYCDPDDGISANADHKRFDSFADLVGHLTAVLEVQG